MNDTRVSQLKRDHPRISIFDSYGMPWTSHLSMGWMIWIFVLTGGMAGIFIGLCLGMWIRMKTGSAIVLIIYVLLTVGCVALFLPDSVIAQHWADSVGLAAVILWFTGALVSRYQIARYYTQAEGSEFRLSLVFTLLFGVWYLNYRVRPEFPNDPRLRAEIKQS